MTRFKIHHLLIIAIVALVIIVPTDKRDVFLLEHVFTVSNLIIAVIIAGAVGALRSKQSKPQILPVVAGNIAPVAPAPVDVAKQIANLRSNRSKKLAHLQDLEKSDKHHIYRDEVARIDAEIERLQKGGKP